MAASLPFIRLATFSLKGVINREPGSFRLPRPVDRSIRGGLPLILI